jgi:RNA-directed DNA polymerase
MDGAQRSQNLSAAWKRVKRNKGAPGIDGMTVEDFPAFKQEHWPRIATAIREGNYRPAPVRRAWIIPPVAGSAVRLRIV